MKKTHSSPFHLSTHIWFVAACAMLPILVACGTSQPVRVLQDGQSALTASLGGPIVPGESPVGFIPYINLGYMHGLSDDLTVQAELHGLPAVFGTLGADVGIATRLCTEQGWRPECTLKAQGIFFTDFKEARLYPLVSLLGSYEVAERTLAYGGLETLYQFNHSQLYYTPLLGLNFPLSKSMTMQTECKWMAANINTASGVFEGTGSLSSHGGVALFVGVNYAF